MTTDDQWLPALQHHVEVHSDGQVLLDFTDSIATVTLNRPGKLNAINSKVLAGIRAAVTGAAVQDAVRAIVLHGTGRTFSAGGDLGEVSQLVGDKDRFSEFLDYWHGSLWAVQNCPVPTIAAVHGFAYAGGFELTQVCDFVVVGRRTLLGDQHANYGLFPAGGSTQRLPRLVAPRVAKWMLMSGEAVDAPTALALGLANRVVDEDDVLNEARLMAETLAAKSRSGNAAIKAAVLLGSDQPLPHAIAAERAVAVDHMASSDVQTGMDAFRTHTKPIF